MLHKLAPEVKCGSSHHWLSFGPVGWSEDVLSLRLVFQETIIVLWKALLLFLLDALICDRLSVRVCSTCDPK